MELWLALAGCPGPDVPTTSPPGTPPVITDPSAGTAVAGAGDVDGDGYDDLLVSAEWYGAGRVYLVGGGPVPAPALDLASAVAVLNGEQANDAAGVAIAGAGDVDGDGHGDVVVAAVLQTDPVADQSGRVYLLRGPITGEVDLGAADGIRNGEAEFDEAGSALAGVGDTNGDGFDDVLVGSGSNGGGAGRAYLLLGPWSGTDDLGSADAVVTGEPGDYLGETVAAAGDVDGDGLLDVWIGATSRAYRGEALLVRGPVPASLDSAGADAALYSGSGDTVGPYLSGAGDVDGDGHADVVVGVPGLTSYRDPGAVYVVLGPFDGRVAIDEVAVARFEGEAFRDLAGTVVASAGDANGDDLDDIVIGAIGWDAVGYLGSGTATPVADAGRVYLVLAPFGGESTLGEAQAVASGVVASDRVGDSAAGAGDVDGDGTDDLIISNEPDGALLVLGR